MKITIIDYNIGNIGSIKNMLIRIGGFPSVTSDKSAILSSEKLILPGVGSFDAGIKNLKKLGLYEILKDKNFYKNKKLLGICLGMQLLAQNSEEGIESGLNLVPGKVKKFNFGTNSKNYKIPHMMWNSVNSQKDDLFFKELNSENKFYFCHSYFFECSKPEYSIGKTEYNQLFTSVIKNKNIYGVQFHPEKSHKYGMKLLKNFIEL